jgi:hypothetical protein
MSNAILPLALLGSIGSSVAGVVYGIRTEWEFLGGKKEVAPPPPPPTTTQASAFGAELDTSMGDFVMAANDNEEVYSSVVSAALRSEDDAEVYSKTQTLGSGEEPLDKLASSPITCESNDDETTALEGFMLRDTGYKYGCATIDEPGKAELGKYGTKGNSDQGQVSGLSSKSAVCGPKQAMTSFVLHPNRSGSKVQYKFDCIDLKGPTKIRTATTRYSTYDEENGLQSLQNAALDIKCRPDEELLQGFGLERSGKNIRYVYRCVTPGYEED